MTALTRRRALLGLLAAPVIIRTAGLLMPVKAAPAELRFLDLQVGDYFIVVADGTKRLHIVQDIVFGAEEMSRPEILAALRVTKARTITAITDSSAGITAYCEKQFAEGLPPI